jgi:hypothetical protein
VTEITSDKLRDFQLCRYLYQQKQINGRCEHARRTDRELLRDKMEQTLIKVICFAYFEKMENKIVTYSQVINRWEKLWFGDMNREDVFGSVNSPGRNIHSINTDAMEILNRFYASFERDNAVVTMLSEPYTVPIGDSGVCHDFVTLAVRRGDVHYLEYYTTKSAKAFMPGSERYHKAILDSMAYSRDFDVIPIVKVNHLKSNKIDEYIPTTLQWRQLIELADEMSETDRYPASGHNYWCDRCQFKDECHGWQ